MMVAPLAVVILTYNEELNLPGALESVCDWANQVFIVDSFSTDRTVEIAKAHSAGVYQHPFEHWATQRNWALDNLPIQTPWVLFLDADERVTAELAHEMAEMLPQAPPEVAGFYVNRRFFFMNRWLKRGGYSPNWVLRLVRPEETRVIPAGDREYFQVSGIVRRLKGHLIHEDQRGLDFWIAKHNRISEMAAHKLASSASHTGKDGSGELEGRWRVWIRDHIVDKLPLLLQPFIFFVYRYFLRLGILDGKEGLVYYFLHDFWYPFLVAAKTMELKKKPERAG